MKETEKEYLSIIGDYVTGKGLKMPENVPGFVAFLFKMIKPDLVQSIVTDLIYQIQEKNA